MRLPSSLQVLSGHLSETFSDSMMAVEELRPTGTVILAQWIPFHFDIKGSEDADTLANRGRDEEQPEVPASFADCKAQYVVEWPTCGKLLSGEMMTIPYQK